MKSLKLIISLILINLIVFIAGQHSVDQVLASEELLKNYSDCLLDKGPCTEEGAFLKSEIPKVLKEGCPNCSPKEKELIEKTLAFLIKNQPKLWKELEIKYDVDGKYREKYNELFMRIKA